MSRTKYLYEEFIRICKTLNGQLQITPVLYGSLGLGKAAQTDFLPQDIDVLVPLVYLGKKWDALSEVMNQLGYSLINLREHEFSNGEMQFGFSFLEDLKHFADVDYQVLETVEDSGAAYHVLTAAQYLSVYTKSSADGYRRENNNQKDLKKIEFLRKMKEADGMIKGLYEAHLPVRNLEKSIGFYQKLELELAYQTDKLAFFWLEKGRSWLGLWETEKAETPYHPSLRHIAFHVSIEDIRNARDWLETRGIEARTAFGFSPEQQPLILPNNPHAHAAVYFHDLDGNSLELIAPLRLDVNEEFEMMSLAEWDNKHSER